MTRRLLLIDPDPRRIVLAKRLRAQRYAVEVFESVEQGISTALASPPDVIVADLWMPRISGVQLCRLLTGEAATSEIPIVLRVSRDTPRNRFWARHAGASRVVQKGRVGELLRALKSLPFTQESMFFLHLSNEVDVRERIASHLDRALFESVVASEVRALGSVGSFEQLVDELSQVLVQLTGYRWMVLTSQGRHVGIHCRPEVREQAIAEATEQLGELPEGDWTIVEDDDASDAPGVDAFARPIHFAGTTLGAIAVCPVANSEGIRDLVTLVAGELGGALRIITLLEETHRLATTDALTGLMRRDHLARRLTEALQETPTACLVLMDLDLFKQVNDTCGHAAGDQVLAAAGACLAKAAAGGCAARWGGEEFLVFVRGDGARGLEVAEAARQMLHTIEITAPNGERVPISASFGVARYRRGESVEATIDRADRAMYASKTAGRDRVTAAWAEDRDVELA